MIDYCRKRALEIGVTPFRYMGAFSDGLGGGCEYYFRSDTCAKLRRAYEDGATCKKALTQEQEAGTLGIQRGEKPTKPITKK